MPWFKRRKSTSKELVIILQKRVEQLENTVTELLRRVEMLEATRHGRITESPPVKVNGDDCEVDGHQADVVEDCEVTVDVNCENIMEEEDEIEQTVKDDSVEETALTCVEGVNGQENKLEQVGEAECVEETVLGCVEDVYGEEDKLEQVGEDEGLEETVLVHEEGLQGEDSGTEAATQSHQGLYNRRIRRIGICVVSCAVGILWGLYRWGGYGWGEDNSYLDPIHIDPVYDCTIPGRHWLPPMH